MKTLQIRNCSIAFGDRVLFNDLSFSLDSHSRAALAGANGSGKTTLLKIVSGLMSADDITISKTKDSIISYLPQSDIVLPNKSVYDAVEEGYSRFSESKKRKEEIENILAKITENDNYEPLLLESEEIEDYLLSNGYYERQQTIEMILQGLGFKLKDIKRPCSEFSGGWQMRIALAKILAENPDFMLLDEPTNYLDIEAVVWLKNYLKSFNGGIFLVSHDQGFLDDTVNNVYELFQAKLTRYVGNYTKYLQIREEEIKQLEKAYIKQQEEIEKTEDFIERFRYKATKAKQVQSRVKALEKIEVIEIPGHLKKLSFSFPTPPHSGNDIVIVNDFGKAYGSNVIYKDFSFLVRKKERLAITGRNGTGKSTLLRILAGVDTDFTGEVRMGAGVKRGYFAQDNDKELDPTNTVLQEVEGVADTKDLPKVRNLLGSFLFSDDDVFKKTSVLSGGEKSRLALLKILFHPANLLLLDEPTNHLDINSKQMLEEAIKAYDGTLIFVSHDTSFIKNLATRILYLSEDGPEFFEGDYDYFEYKLEQKEAKYLNYDANKKNRTSNSPVAKIAPLSREEEKAKKSRIRSLEKECETLLEKHAALLKEIERLDKEMALVENYSNASKITKLVKEKMDAEEMAENAEMLWLEKNEALEKAKE